MFFRKHNVRNKIRTDKRSHSSGECSIRLSRVNEQHCKHHERFEHGSDVEDCLIVVAFGEDGRQLVSHDGGEVHHCHIAGELSSSNFRPSHPHHE